MITGNDITFCQSHCSLKIHLANCSFGCNVRWNVFGVWSFWGGWVVFGVGVLGVWGCIWGGWNVFGEGGMFWGGWDVFGEGGMSGVILSEELAVFSEAITQNLGSDVRKTQSSNKKTAEFSKTICKMQVTAQSIRCRRQRSLQNACKLLKACCASFAHGLDPHALRRY